MHLEIIVEEPSAEAALMHLLPRIVRPEVTFNIIVHQGKPDLMGKLQGRLRGYSKWIPDDYRIIILVDEDREDCRMLKSRLEHAALNAGLRTKSAPGPSGDFSVVNRLAIEELEAWFFGDVPALVKAFPRVPASLGTKSRYADPDAIAGGTWEALARVLKRAGYYPSGLAKIEAAWRIAAHMDPENNRSRSFQVFRSVIESMAG
jgi:hypothetical protein